MSDDVEAIRRLKGRCCRFLDTKDYHAWRGLFAADVVVKLDLAVSSGGADAATMHHCHTLTSDTTATGCWAMEDLLIFADGNQLHGAGHCA